MTPEEQMAKLKEDFEGVAKTDKLIMAYLAFGNSIWDVLSKLVTYLPAEEKLQILSDILDEDDNDPELKFSDSLLAIYEDFGKSINSPIAG